MKKQALNPYLPSYEYIPDGEPYVFDGRVYIYGSHDRFNSMEYCANDYVCYSTSADALGDWRFEGVIYSKTQDPLYCDPKSQLYAPDVQKGCDGRYYLYYALAGVNAISVAVCDTPAGKFEFYGHVHHSDGTLYGEKEGDGNSFDPGVLFEGEKRYLYSGFCPDFSRGRVPKNMKEVKGAMLVELEQDMLSIIGEPKVIVPSIGNAQGTAYEGHEFFEASSIRKRNGWYYFIYSSIQGHELCYAMSDYPDRDFKYGGTIISNGDIGLENRTFDMPANYIGNNHGSIIEINDKWYVFYHRQTNRNQFNRQGCAEEISFHMDGTIPQVEMTSCGLNGGPLRGKGRYEARIACNLWSRKGAVMYGLGDREISEIHPYFTQDGEDRENMPNQHIANMCDGAVAGFKYFDIKVLTGIRVIIRGNGKGKLLISRTAEEEPFAELELCTHADWSKVETKAELEDQVISLYFTYRGEGTFDFLEFELF